MHDLKLDILYRFEHEMLPRWFYFGKENLIRQLSEDDGLYTLFDEACRKERRKNRYAREAFSVKQKEIEGLQVCILQFPAGGNPLYCRRILLLFEPDFSNMAFYTVENGEDSPWMGRWDLEIKYNYAPVTDFAIDGERGEMEEAFSHYLKQEVRYE